MTPAEELSPLGKVVLIMTVHGLADDDVFESPSGWMISGAMSGTVWFVSATSGAIRVCTSMRWADVEVVS